MNAGKVLAIVLLVALSTGSAGSAAPIVGPITFGPGDYDNTPNTVIAGPTPVYNQTTGKFRDVMWWSLNNGQPRVGSGDYINQGNSLILVGISAAPGPGPYTALNFTGPAVSGGQSYLSIYDTTPADGGTKDVFDATQTIEISADVLFVVHSVSAGVVALYNEGQDALALLASNGGGNNPDIPKVSLVWQSPGTGLTLDSVSLPAGTFVQENWYRVAMELTVAGDTWTMNGSFRNHVDGSDPTSALGGLITSLTYTGSLSDPDASARVLTNPGEVGVMAIGNEPISLPDNVGVSVTNFQVTPEPLTLSLLVLGGLALIRRRGRLPR
jgi:MYXO-CTERM domain-containing protein